MKIREIPLEAIQGSAYQPRRQTDREIARLARSIRRNGLRIPVVLREKVEYQGRLGLPPRARMDSIHLACAVAHEMDYLLTWNCAHLANGMVIRRLETMNAILGLKTSTIVTPEELMEPPGEGV